MTNSKVCIIAEAGVNHNGNMQLAEELIDIAAQAEADIIKFQSFVAENIVTHKAPRAEYQRTKNAAEDSQLSLLRNLEMPRPAHFQLKQMADSKGIEFLSTGFDVSDLRFLVDEVGIRRIKIPSGEITNPLLLLYAARTRKDIILSTGMCSLSEIEFALSCLAFGFQSEAQEFPNEPRLRKALGSPEGQAALSAQVKILHCSTAYPTPPDEVNLRALETLKSAFGLPVGLSDHSLGIEIPIAAAAMGAVIIEKHITLDKKMAGPDHAASLNPEELQNMVAGIRKVEAAMGHGRKIPMESELSNLNIARKVIVASRDIRKGDKFSADNLTLKRAGSGIAAQQYFSILGKTAESDFSKEEPITT